MEPMDDDIKLTREEVDVLLNVADAVGRGVTHQTAAPSVRPYDFRRPDTMSKDHERTIGMVNTNFARHLAGMLSTILRGLVSVEIEEYKETEYQHFHQDVPNLSLMALCSIPPMEGKVLFTFDPHFSMFLIDRLLGGPGQIPKAVRELTEIELALMRQVVNRVLTSWKESLESIISLKPSIDQLEPNSNLVHFVSATSPVMMVSLSVSMRNMSGNMRMCIPHQALKPLLPAFHEHFWMRGRGGDTSAVQAAPEVRPHLMATPVSLNLQLGEAAITVDDLLSLQEGDCVVLNRGENEELPVLIAGKHHLWGRLGVNNDNYAVSITRWEESQDVQFEDGSDEE